MLVHSDQKPPKRHGANPTLDDSAKRALNQTRLIWAAAMAEVILTLGLGVVVVQTRALGSAPGLAEVLWPINLGLTPVLIAIGYVARMQTYKRFWVGSRVDPAGYFTANLLLFALVDLAGLLGVIVVVLSGELGPEALWPLLCLVVLGLNFPTGKPMTD